MLPASRVKTGASVTETQRDPAIAGPRWRDCQLDHVTQKAEHADCQRHPPPSASHPNVIEERKRIAAALARNVAFTAAADFFLPSNDETQGATCTLCSAVVSHDREEMEAHIFREHYGLFRFRPHEHDRIERKRRSTSIFSAPSHMTTLGIYHGDSTIRLRHDTARPQPRAKEALIRVLRAGICGTDLAMINNYKPGYEGALGHEFVGIVEEIGADAGDSEDEHLRRLWLGQRVVGEINVPCNDLDGCRVCRAYHAQQCHPPDGNQLEPSAATTKAAVAQRNHCPNREALGIVGRSGAFAEYITLPVANLLVVPDNVPDAHAVFAEPLAAACRVVEQRIVEPTDRVAVLGDGRLGLLIAEVLAAERVAESITVIGKHPEKLALVESVVDCTLMYHPAMRTSHCGAFDVVVECTATPVGLALALSLVRPRRGRIVMKSTCAAKTSPVPMSALPPGADVQIIGSRCGPFAPALRLLGSGRVDVQKYIEAAYPLTQGPAAITHAARRGTMKIQLVMTSASSSTHHQ